MGYRDDLYTARNIIGYTGTVHLDPTVYFQCGQEYGRITQNHPFKENNGRSEVGSCADYRIENLRVYGQMRCVEFDGETAIHFSRSLFVPIARATKLQRAVLARSIFNYPEKKVFDDMSAEDQELLLDGPRIPSVDVKGLIGAFEGTLADTNP